MNFAHNINNYQRPFIKFNDHRFYVHILAENRLYDAHRFDIKKQADGIDAISKSLSFGDGTQNDNGYISIKIRLGENDKDICWTVTAGSPYLIKGIKVEITNIPFKNLVNPFGQHVDINDGSGYASAFPAGVYPSRVLPTSGIDNGSWLPTALAQFMVINTNDGTLLIRSEDYPPKFKRYWFFRNGAKINLTTYTEANASEKNKVFSTPKYFLENTDGIADALKRHDTWMKEAYKLVSFDKRNDIPNWVKKICLNLNFHCHATDGTILNTFSTIEKRLEQTAKFFDPNLTHIHIVGWDGQWDFTWPYLKSGSPLIFSFYQISD